MTTHGKPSADREITNKTTRSVGLGVRSRMDSLLFAYIIPMELTNGNEGRTKHFGSTIKVRRDVERILPKREPFLSPVVVHVTRILGKGQRMWDSSSGLRGNYKEIEDAMVARGWFVDDSPAWIKETRFFQCCDRRSVGPCIQIEIFSA